MFPTTARLTLYLLVSILRTSLLFPFAVASPTNPKTLPSFLLDNTPVCAQDCLATFIQEELFSCTNPESIDCLCEADSANGYTLGEGALACIADQCPFAYVNQYSGVYQICSSDKNAKPVTHYTLSAAVATATRSAGDVSTDSTALARSDVSAAASTTLAVTTSSLPTSIPSSAAVTTTSSSSDLTSASSTVSSSSDDPFAGLTFDTSASPTPRSFTYITTTTTSATTTTAVQNAAAATSSAAPPQPVLSGGQVAGITIAGIAITAAAIGLLLFFFCGKKYRERMRKRSSHDSFIQKNSPKDIEQGSSIGDGVIHPESPLIPIPAAPPRSFHGGQKAHQFLGLPVAPNQHRQSWWSKMGKGVKPLRGPPVPPKADVGIARYLDPTMGGISSDASPRSFASYHTTSGLLPDMPAYHADESPALEKRLSRETAKGHPGGFAAGVGLRIISATPESNQPLRKGWPQADTSQRVLQGLHPANDATLKGKLSDPFIARTNEQQQHQPQNQQFGLMAAFRASRDNGSRGLGTAPNMNYNQPPTQRRSGQGIPNFRTLVNPQAYTLDPGSSLRSPQFGPVSPMTPNLAEDYGPARQAEPQTSIMNRPRGNSSPFFSAQPSQLYSFRQPRKDRSKRNIRPETHYTTSSETEFEDDDLEPVQPVLHPSQKLIVDTRNDSEPMSNRSVRGISELPGGLSPVTESPVSKHAKSPGFISAAKTPSPHESANPFRSKGKSREADVEDSDDELEEGRSTPLSRVRYPQIPGREESPRHEVKHVAIAMGIPRKATAVPVGRLHRVPGAHDLRSNSAKSAVDSDNDDSDIDPEPSEDDGVPVRLDPSPLRPSKPARENLRKEVAAAATQEPSVPELPPPASSSALKFHDAATRLAASSAGLRIDPNDKRGLGNWPVQPVRPVLRPTNIPAPIGAPAFSGSLPTSPIDEVAFSRTNAGPYQIAHAAVNGGVSNGFASSGDHVNVEHNRSSGWPAADQAGSRPESVGRVLVHNMSSQAMPSAPAFSNTRIPAPVGTQPLSAGSQPWVGGAQKYQLYGQQGFQPGYTQRPPSVAQLTQQYQQRHLQQPPAARETQETQQGWNIRASMQQLRGQEMERRREMTAEMQRNKWGY